MLNIVFGVLEDCEDVAALYFFEWNDLVLARSSVPGCRLRDRLEGRSRVSMIGFDFITTKCRIAFSNSRMFPG